MATKEQVRTTLMLALANNQFRSVLSSHALNNGLGFLIENIAYLGDTRLVVNEIKDKANNPTGKFAVSLVQGNGTGISSFVVESGLKKIPRFPSESGDRLFQIYEYWISLSDDILDKFINSLVQLGYKVNWK